jgi:alpha-aminoadipate carrier protein LysW
VKKMTDCIVCGADLAIEEGTEVNEIVVCQDCGTELEVVNLDPLAVQEAPEEEEDWGE